MRGAALLSNGLTLSSGQLGCNLNIPGPGLEKDCTLWSSTEIHRQIGYEQLCRVEGYAGLNMKEDGALQAENMSEFLSNSSLCSRPRDVNASKLKMNLCQTLSDPVGI